MNQFQGKTKWKRFFYSQAFAIVLAVILLISSRSVFDVYRKDESARSKEQASAENLAALKAKKAGLEYEIARLKSTRGMEEELRKKFQVAKPGEEVLVIVDKDAGKVADVESKDVPWYSLLWREFTALLSL